MVLVRLPRPSVLAMTRAHAPARRRLLQANYRNSAGDGSGLSTHLDAVLQSSRCALMALGRRKSGEGVGVLRLSRGPTASPNVVGTTLKANNS